MNFSNLLKSPGWCASLAMLGALAACSKSAPSSAAAGTNATSAPPAATTPAPTAAVPAAGSPEQRIIAQGRATIGPEAKLEAINGILMTGQILDDKNTPTGTFVILAQKPARQHTELHEGNQTMVQGSDGVMGWALGIDANGGKKLAVLKGTDEAQNNYETMENLYFYRATERVNGSSVRYEGDVDYRGVKCHKVSFNYPNGISYVRYFDAATGQLRGTVLLPGEGEAVEEGTLVVDGVNFPALLKNYSKDGKLQQVLKFEKIVLNPAIDPKSKPFDLPDMVALAKAAAATRATASGSASGMARPLQSRPASTAPAQVTMPQQPFLSQPLLPSKN
ncbi:MAG TPA: hypothetical protein VHC95_04365 [Opitutales bacterium]|nr:hypothetical protein [Opitutales bacterium]